MRPMMTAAPSPDPATSPHHHAQLARGQHEHVIPVAADTARTPARTGRRPPRYVTAGSAEGTRLRCSASAAAWSSRDLSDCTASAARSAAICSSAASSLVKSRSRTVPTCSTPSTAPSTKQRDARQEAGALLQQQRVQPAAVLDVIQDDRPPLGDECGPRTHVPGIRTPWLTSSSRRRPRWQSAGGPSCPASPRRYRHPGSPGPGPAAW